LEAGAPRIDLQNLINLWRERKEGYIPREYRQAFEEYKPPKKAALSPDTRDLILNQLAPLGEKGAFSENRMKAELLLRKFEESGLNPAILAPDERGVLGVGPKFQAMWERFNPRKTAIPFNADRTAINLTTGQRLPANQWFPGEEPTGPFYRPMNLPTAKRLASTDEFGRPQLNLPQRPQLDPEIVRRQLWLRRLTGQEGPLSPEDYLGRTVRGLLDTLGFRQPSPMEQEWFQKLGVPSW
jgi:hypothetical protein